MDTTTHGHELQCCTDYDASRGRRLPRSTAAIVAGTALVIALASTGGAVAGSLITGKQIKNGTITSADIKNKTIKTRDLAPGARKVGGARGPAGPAGQRGSIGEAGPTGPRGETGERGAAAGESIPSGVTVTDLLEWDQSTTGSTGLDIIQVQLPGLPVVPLTRDDVNFAPDPSVVDTDVACSGSYQRPTAPAGKVCIYLQGLRNVRSPEGVAFGERPVPSFFITYSPSVTTVGADQFLSASWAYTAP